MGDKLNIDEFAEKLKVDGDFECSCHIFPPCAFCTDKVSELYAEYLEKDSQ